MRFNPFRRKPEALEVGDLVRLNSEDYDGLEPGATLRVVRKSEFSPTIYIVEKLASSRFEAHYYMPFHDLEKI